MAYDGPVLPYYGTGVSASTTSSASVATVAAGAKQVMLTVTGTNAIHFRFTGANDTSVATVADAIVNNVNRMLVSKNPDHTRVSLVSPAGASTVHIIGCDGSATM